MTKIEVFIQDDLMRHGTGIFIYKVDELTGKVLKAKKMDIVFEDVDSYDGLEMEPSLHFRYREGQEFLNGLSQALINSGFRDKTISQDGEIRRMNEHLEDMRKIAFKFIDTTTNEKL